MKINEATKEVLVKGGLEWVISHIPDHATDYVVKLIDLDTLSLQVSGRWCDGGNFDAESKLLLFGHDGELLGEVGGMQDKVVSGTALTWRWPFLKTVEITKRVFVRKTVEQALVDLERAAKVRFIIDLPIYWWRGKQKVTIYKLRKSDVDLKTRIKEKQQEAIVELQGVLSS